MPLETFYINSYVRLSSLQYSLSQITLLANLILSDPIPPVLETMFSGIFLCSMRPDSAR
jgi:hypothetical protein